MNAGINTNDWRRKYFDSLRSMENEERQFRAMESALKQLAGRLCIASLGQSSQLDEQVRKLQLAIRRTASSEELEQIIPALTEAIHALDQHAPLKVSETQPIRVADAETACSNIDDVRIRSILASLLAELRRDAELIKQVDLLDAKIAVALPTEQLPELLSTITALVGQRITRIERAKREVETLLSQMVGKLDEIGQFVADQNLDQSQSLASSETLSIQLVDEMQAMGTSVEAADDLQQIRIQVRSRLDMIGQHLQEFQTRETTRASVMQTRNAQMQKRVAELEAEASRLHNQLKDEQRLASIDVLTQIPNRMVYEKRIQEELQRWQRFGQPTCIAAWDIDHFKRINDTYGHRAGDRVLLTVAKALSSRVRATDFLARYGGEEFVMVLTGTRLADAVRIINEMRIVISELVFHFRGKPESMTVSCGVTALQSGDTAGSAFDRADEALYRAKDQGRNCCVSI